MESKSSKPVQRLKKNFFCESNDNYDEQQRDEREDVKEDVKILCGGAE